MQEMTITSVHALGPRYAVILKEKDADRYLPILVGASDANAIAIKLHNPQVSLNLTHDLLCTVIDALGGSGVPPPLAEGEHHRELKLAGGRGRIKILGQRPELHSRPVQALDHLQPVGQPPGEPVNVGDHQGGSIELQTRL